MQPTKKAKNMFDMPGFYANLLSQKTLPAASLVDVNSESNKPWQVHVNHKRPSVKNVGSNPNKVQHTCIIMHQRTCKFEAPRQASSSNHLAVVGIVNDCKYKN